MLAVSILLVFLITVFSEKIKISNLETRRDINNELMDIHDGNIVQWAEGGLYYFYGMGYQNCTLETSIIPPTDCPGIFLPAGHCGFRKDHALRIYSSTNLEKWTLLSENALLNFPEGIYYRPKVIYNELTSLYVLWINYLPPAFNPLLSYPKAVYLSGTSPSQMGPFQLKNSKANIKYTGAGDFSILVDKKDKSKAYLAYDAWENSHTISIEQLTLDFTDAIATTNTGSLSPSSNEAPILFQRGDYYYLIYGSTCCFCREGAGAAVMTATSPLGVWTSLNNLELNPKQSFFSSSHIIKGQNSFVFEAQLSKGESTFIFVSDLWTSADDKLKSHDKQFWTQLIFDENTIPPSPTPFVWQDNFELDVKSGKNDNKKIEIT